jgi:hypothetical protein
MRGNDQKFPLFSKLRTREAALSVLAATSIAILVWLAIQILVLIFVLGRFSIISVSVLIVYGALVFFLWKFNSRTAAVLLLILLTYSLVYGISQSPQGTLIIAGIVGPFIWFAVRAVEATFKLHGRFK